MLTFQNILTFFHIILKRNLCIPKKADGTWVISAEEEQGAHRHPAVIHLISRRDLQHSAQERKNGSNGIDSCWVKSKKL